MEYWGVGVVEDWNNGMLEYWGDGAMEQWSNGNENPFRVRVLNNKAPL